VIWQSVQHATKETRSHTDVTYAACRFDTPNDGRPLQLTGEGLLPFNTDKQTAFGLAVFYAFLDATSLYAVNVSSFTVDSPKSTRR
jgi:hypothetical protein